MPKSNDRLYRKTRGGKPYGSWYGWYYCDSGARVVVNLKTRDRRTARTRLRQAEREAASTHSAAHQGKTFYSLFDAVADFLTGGRGRRSEATLSMYEQKGRHLLRGLGYETDINTLTLDDVEAHVALRRSEEAHEASIYKEMVALRQVLKYAKKKRRFGGDPRALIPDDVANMYVPRERHLERDELPKLLEKLRLHRRWWVIVAVYVGGRSSEIERLTWGEHVDLQSGWISVPGTKTTGARRKVPINSFLRTCLEAIPDKSGPLVERWGQVRRDLAAACKRAKIPKVTPNDLRRTFSSWLLQEGELPFTVAKLLGHTTTRMVERVYGHLADENYRRAVDKLPMPASDEMAEQLAETTRLRSKCVANSASSGAEMARMSQPPDQETPAEPVCEGSQVPRGGIEPPTRGFSVRCSTN